MSCRAEVVCYQIVQSHVVFSYVISQSDAEHVDLYCSNIKHHYLYCLCVGSYASSILPHCYVLVNSPTTLGLGHQVHGSHLHWSGKRGACSCFEEFNCLEEAVLSEVSIQIQPIQDSI